MFEAEQEWVKEGFEVGVVEGVRRGGHTGEHEIEQVRTAFIYRCTDPGCGWRETEFDPPLKWELDVVAFCEARHPIRGDWVCEDFDGHLTAVPPRKHSFIVEAVEEWD